VRGGEGLTAGQRDQLGRAVQRASQASGLPFRVYVGRLDQGRATALRVHAECGAAAADTVLVAVDPTTRRLEIVTGARAAEAVDDRTCGLASLAMTSSFAGGDLVGGLRQGLQMLAAHARHPLSRRPGRSEP
jgi:uncharacterized membrane protein YgcG